MTGIVSFDGVSVTYGRVAVLHTVSFTVEAGEWMGVLGPNGAGKSTLFEMVCGGASPDEGRVTVRAGARLGYVRQHVDAQASTMSLLEHVENAVPEIARIHAIAQTHHEFPVRSLKYKFDMGS